MKTLSGMVDHHLAVVIQVIFNKNLLPGLVFLNRGFGDDTPGFAAERGGNFRVKPPVPIPRKGYYHSHKLPTRCIFL